jgi:hypothetical protein
VGAWAPAKDGPPTRHAVRSSAGWGPEWTVPLTGGSLGFLKRPAALPGALCLHLRSRATARTWKLRAPARSGAWPRRARSCYSRIHVDRKWFCRKGMPAEHFATKLSSVFNEVVIDGMRATTHRLSGGGTAASNASLNQGANSPDCGGGAVRILKHDLRHDARRSSHAGRVHIAGPAGNACRTDVRSGGRIGWRRRRRRRRHVGCNQRPDGCASAMSGNDQLLPPAFALGGNSQVPRCDWVT